MTDPEISRQLALAIGWNQAEVFSMLGCLVRFKEDDRQGWIYFDYRYWSVIGPIAERYDCFPSSISTGNFRKSKTQGYTDVAQWEVIRCNYARSTEQSAKWEYVVEDTPQKAIAMAVIGAKK